MYKVGSGKKPYCLLTKVRLICNKTSIWVLRWDCTNLALCDMYMLHYFTISLHLLHLSKGWFVMRPWHFFRDSMVYTCPYWGAISTYKLLFFWSKIDVPLKYCRNLKSIKVFESWWIYVRIVAWNICLLNALEIPV